MRGAGKRMLRWAVGLGGLGLLLLLGWVLWGAFMLPPRDQVSARLATLYRDDQAARADGFADLGSLLRLTVGDWQRQTLVRRMVDAQLLSSAEDHYHAAMILQHGSTAADYLQAQALAEQATALGDARGVRLRALAEDRYLVSLGQPQRYGSQFHCVSPQGWQLQPVDPAVTDAERDAAGMPPLATQQARVARMQEVTGGQCALSAEAMSQIQSIMEE